MQKTGIAAIAADFFDREPPLVGQRQREEFVRLRKGFGDQRCLDPVVDDIKEADVPAGGADVGRDPSSATPHRFRPTT